MGEVQAAFDRDLAWARRTLAEARSYPLPDLTGWEQSKNIFAPWNYHDDWEEALQECDRRALDGDFLSRLVSVTWVSHLLETLENTEPFHEFDDAVPTQDEIADVRLKLIDLVTLVGPSDVPDARVAEWELGCRAVLGLWDEAGPMLDRFMVLARPGEREARILRGQFWMTVGVARSGRCPSSWWRLRVDEGFGGGPAEDLPEFATVSAAHRPDLLMGYSLVNAPNSVVAGAADWIEAAHQLEIADVLAPLPLHYVTAMALGRLLRGSTADALVAYKRFAAERPWLATALPGVRRWAALAIAKVDARSGIPLIDGYLRDESEVEGRQELYFLLAKLYIATDNRYAEALAVLDRAVDEFPGLETDPATGVGLALGRIGIDAMNPLVIRQRGPLPPEVERLASGFLQQLVAGYDRLHQQTRRDLVTAAASLYAGIWPRENVMTVFWAARALENELHHRVVAPLASGKATGKKTGPTLGQVFFAIIEPRGDDERKVQREVFRLYPKVQTWAVLDAKPLVRWRNAVVHPFSDIEPGREDAVEFFRSATRFLSLFA